MSLFKYHPSRVAHFSEVRARKAVDERARQQAEAAPEPAAATKPAAEPAPKLDPSSPVDPFLQDLEAREAAARPAPASAGPPEGNGTKESAPAPAGQPTSEEIRRAEDHIIQALSNLHTASRRDVVRAIHGDRHPEAFKAAWKALRRAGRIVRAESTGRAVLWRLASDE